LDNRLHKSHDTLATILCCTRLYTTCATFRQTSLHLDLMLLRELTGNFCYSKHSPTQTHICTHLYLALSIFWISLPEPVVTAPMCLFKNKCHAVSIVSSKLWVRNSFDRHFHLTMKSATRRSFLPKNGVTPCMMAVRAPAKGIPASSGPKAPLAIWRSKYFKKLVSDSCNASVAKTISPLSTRAPVRKGSNLINHLNNKQLYN